jgi:hypothetical protein
MQGVLWWVTFGAIALAIVLRALGSKIWSGSILLAVQPWIAAAFASEQRPEALVAMFVGSAAAGAIALLAIVLLFRIFGVRITLERAANAPAP